MAIAIDKAIIGDSQREAGIWMGVGVAVFLGAFILLQVWNTLAQFVLVSIGATAIGVIFAGYQAYQNGSVAASWLLVAGPRAAIWVDGYLRVGGLPSGWALEILSDVILILFLGTTAFLLGMEAAKAQDTVPRTLAETEQRVLLAVLLVTGGLFAYWSVLPLY